MADPNPELGSGGELPDELELETGKEGEHVAAPEDLIQGVDPLDDIKDEGKRAEAKKHRAIARRTGKVPEPVVPKVETPTPEAPKQEFVTKQEFQKANEKKAITEAIADPTVKANWAEIAPLYVPRHGRETSEDIAKDIKDAIILFNGRNTAEPVDDSKRDLTVTPAIIPGGGPIVKNAPKLPALPNYHLPTQPKDWYVPKAG